MRVASQRLRRWPVGHIHRQRERATAQRFDFGDDLVRFVVTLVTGEGDVRAGFRQATSMARPMPRLPPVTKAVLPAREKRLICDPCGR